MARQVAFHFGETGLADPKVLGGKGAGLAQLVKLGIPVPPGFSLTTALWRAFNQHRRLPVRLMHQMQWQMSALERITGKRFGKAANPLLVSVRSGAPVSMPGMMDTVLNLGLNESTVAGLAKVIGERAAWDCYRRFLQLYGSVVLGVSRQTFEHVLDNYRLVDTGANGTVTARDSIVILEDRQLSAAAWQDVCEQFKTLICKTSGRLVPSCPWEQLETAVVAVLDSWNNQRARDYRQSEKIAADLGTAVTIQSMVFGNSGEDSCTGVVFSRDCAVGTPGLWGEFLINAQGEDVVAGTTTPMPIAGMKEWNPAIYNQLAEIARTLELRRKHVVDIEFTVEHGKLFILQVRAAKLTPEAAITAATHHIWEAVLTKAEAMHNITDGQVAAVQAHAFEPSKLQAACATRLLARGLPASPGAAVGKLVRSSRSAVAAAARGEEVILFTPDTSPDDLAGMLAAKAIVTGTGGTTSHAAVVARGLGKPAVTACGSLPADEGEIVSVDGKSGTVVSGAVELSSSGDKKEINLFLRWWTALQRNKYKPKLSFAAFKQKVRYNRMINDFYLAEALVQALSGTRSETQAIALRNQIHQDTAERMAMYLVVAVGGELRHMKLDNTKEQEGRELLEKYKISLGGARCDAQNRSIKALEAMSPKDHIHFLELSAKCFERCFYSSYGGRPWANIARAAQDFLTGKLGPTVFADHAFDLQHNSGSVFGKNQMLYGDRYVAERQLTAKKCSSGLVMLLTKLLPLKEAWSPKLIRLTGEAQVLGIISADLVSQMA